MTGGGLIVRLFSWLVRKLNNIARQWGVPTALVNLVLEYEFDKIDEDGEVWIVDSGADAHMVKNEKLLRNAIPCALDSDGDSDGESWLKETYMGDAYLPIGNLTNSTIRLRDVLSHDPCVTQNLISVSRLTTDYPFFFEFYPTEFFLKNAKTNEIIVNGPQIRNTYYWPTPKVEAWRTAPTRLDLITIIKAIWKHVIGCLKDYLIFQLLKMLNPILCYDNSNLPRRVNRQWIVDSGATHHVTFDETILQNHRAPECRLGSQVNGRTLVITHVGDVYLQSKRLGGGMLIHGVSLIPEFDVNILSVPALTSEFSSYFKFGPSGFVMKSLDTNKVIAKGTKRTEGYCWGNKSLISRGMTTDKSLKRTNKGNQQGGINKEERKTSLALFRSTKL